MLDDKKILNRYFRNTIFVVGFCISVIFFSLALRSRSLIHEQLLTRARAQFNGILLMRRWSAQHGGVYVIKNSGEQSSPFLENPDLIATDGKVLTLKVPSIMTREISDLAAQNDLFTFHLTSLLLLNPHNAPDAFEIQSLNSFEAGNKESLLVEDKSDGARFRYMVPLMVEPSCLTCHAKQGYTVGQVRGGISVSFNIDGVNQSLTKDNFLIAGLFIATIGLIFLILWRFNRHMQRRLEESHALLQRLATIDILTNVANRATLMTRFSESFARYRRQSIKLGCLMIDVDHFKAVNDYYGHQKGDDVLKMLASIVSGIMRPYDTFGRYGGEEFLMVLEGVDEERLKIAAERTRSLVEEQLSTQTDLVEPVTISLGGTLAFQKDQSIEDVIGRADKALFMAKDRGRNRVVVLADSSNTSKVSTSF